MKTLVERFKEPSSWAGFAVLWGFFGARYIPFEFVSELGVAFCSLAAYLLKEKSA